MKFIKAIWHNFKAQPDVWFFYGFLITFTLSIRKVLFFYPISGQFNEYGGIYLYLSDIFLVLTIILWVISILQNKSYNLSRYKSFLVQNKILFIIPLLLVLWSFISIGWADNENIAIFRSIKLLGFYMLYIYIVFSVPSQYQCSTWNMLRDKRGTIFKRILQITIFFGLFQAIIGIWQFIIQKSVGLFWLKESLISPETLGVAKVILGGEKFIRSYGLFPHPNMLGGFLLFSIIFTFIYYKCHSERSETKSKNLIRSLGKLGMTMVIIQFIALLLTFSKSAILGLAIALVYTMFHACPVKLKCSPWNILYFTGMEHKKKIILLVAILALLVIIIKPDINSLLFKSLDERALYANVSRGTILAHPLIGLGSGQFVLNMSKFAPHRTNLEFWQYQPVHNIFLLIWSELGIVGLGLFLWWIWRLFRTEQEIPKRDINCSTWNNDKCEVYEPAKQTNVPRGTLMLNKQVLRILKGLLLGVIFIMLFDHYFWDIQQGQIMLWLLAGLIAGVANHDNLDPV